MVSLGEQLVVKEDLVKEDLLGRGSDGGLGCEYVNSCMELAHPDDVHPEPLGCDGSDVDNRESAIYHTGDPAFVHTFYSCFNSLDDASDVRC